MQYKLDKPVQATSSAEKYQCTIEWRNGKFITDEPEITGGKDAGPDPFTLLLSALATSTLVTMRMYIERMGWTIPAIAVNANMYQETKNEKTKTVFDCDIVFMSETDEQQKKALFEIAKTSPLAKIFEEEVNVRTFLLRDEPTRKKINYPNDEITVVWKPEFCQHSQRCWQQLPEVFDFKKTHWITPNEAPSEKIIEQIKRCPSGALSFFYNKPK